MDATVRGHVLFLQEHEMVGDAEFSFVVIDKLGKSQVVKTNDAGEYRFTLPSATLPIQLFFARHFREEKGEEATFWQLETVPSLKLPPTMKSGDEKRDHELIAPPTLYELNPVAELLAELPDALSLGKGVETPLQTLATQSALTVTALQNLGTKWDTLNEALSALAGSHEKIAEALRNESFVVKRPDGTVVAFSGLVPTMSKIHEDGLLTLDPEPPVPPMPPSETTVRALITAQQDRWKPVLLLIEQAAVNLRAAPSELHDSVNNLRGRLESFVKKQLKEDRVTAANAPALHDEITRRNRQLASEAQAVLQGAKNAALGQAESEHIPLLERLAYRKAAPILAEVSEKVSAALG